MTELVFVKIFVVLVEGLRLCLSSDDFRDQVTVKDCCRGIFTMLKRAWSWEMTAEHRPTGLTNWKRPNTPFPSMLTVHCWVLCGFHVNHFRIKPKLDELGSLHARHLLRPSLDDRCEEEELIEDLSQNLSKLISSTHRHIQCIRSSLEYGKSTVRYLKDHWLIIIC